MCLLTSTAIALADTWFHVTTKAVLFTQIIPTLPTLSLGRGLSPSCLSHYDSYTAPCSIIDKPLMQVLGNETIAYPTVNNLSATNHAELIYAESRIYAILTNPSAPENLDYTTNTFAVSTQCKPIGRQCDLRVVTNSAFFDCSPMNFMGNAFAGMKDPLLQFFEDPAGTKNVTPSSAVNSFYFALAAYIDSVDGVYPDPLYLANDPNAAIPEHGLSIVLFCNDPQALSTAAEEKA